MVLSAPDPLVVHHRTPRQLPFRSDHPLPGLPRAAPPAPGDRPLGPRPAPKTVGRAAPRPPLAAPAPAHTLMRETDGKGSAASELVPVSPAPLVVLVLDSLASPHSRRAYHRALSEFLAWYPSNASGEGFTRAVLGRYRSHLIERGLSAASVNLSLAALRKAGLRSRRPRGALPPGRRRDLRRPRRPPHGRPDRQLADPPPSPAAAGRP